MIYHGLLLEKYSSLELLIELFKKNDSHNVFFSKKCDGLGLRIGLWRVKDFRIQLEDIRQFRSGLSPTGLEGLVYPQQVQQVCSIPNRSSRSSLSPTKSETFINFENFSLNAFSSSDDDSWRRDAISRMWAERRQMIYTPLFKFNVCTDFRI